MYIFVFFYHLNEIGFSGFTLYTTLSKAQLDTIGSNVVFPSYQRSVWFPHRPDSAEPHLDAITTTMALVNHSSLEAVVETRTIIKLKNHA